MPTGYIWDYPDYFHLTHLERQFFEVCRKLVEEGFTYDYAEPSGASGCRVKYIQFKLPNQSGFLSEKVRNLLKSSESIRWHEVTMMEGFMVQTPYACLTIWPNYQVQADYQNY